VNGDEVRELAAVYALGGLDGEDRARFERLLGAGDREATAALHDFEAILAELASESAEAPPAGVKAALMDRIAAEERARASAVPVRPLPARPSARRAGWPMVGAALAAAGIAAIAVGAGVSATYEKRVEALRREEQALRAELARQQGTLALLRDPATEVVALAGLGPAPSAKARMIWNAPLGGLLVTAGLPPAPEGKTYQLWAIAGKNAPVSGGVFGVDPTGAASLRVPPLPGVDKVDVFAVSLEPAGGLPAPSGQLYLAGKT